MGGSKWGGSKWGGSKWREGKPSRHKTWPKSLQMSPALQIQSAEIHREIPIPENCPPENCPPENCPPENCPPENSGPEYRPAEISRTETCAETCAEPSQALLLALAGSQLEAIAAILRAHEARIGQELIMKR